MKIPATLRYLKAVPLSFYSRSLYRKVCSAWQGVGVKYLLVLLAIGLLPVAVKLHSNIQEMLDIAGVSRDESGNVILSDNLRNIAEQVPEMTYSNGQLVVHDEQPHIVTDPESNEDIVIIDTKNTDFPPDNNTAIAFVARNFLLLRQDESAVQRVELRRIAELFKIPDSTQININSDIAQDWMRQAVKYSGIMPVVFYILKIVEYFIDFGTRALLFGLVAIAFCHMLKMPELPFKQRFRLAAVAATPIIVLEMAALLTGTSIFAKRDIVYFLIHGVYVFIAIEANKGVVAHRDK